MTAKHFIERSLGAALAIGLILTPIGYYLAAKGQTSAFPTYLSGLAWLGLCLFRTPRRALLASPVVWASTAVSLWLALTTTWGPGSLQTTLLYFGFALLLLGYIHGTLLTASNWPSFIEWLVTLTILSASLSAAYSIYGFYRTGLHAPDDVTRLLAFGRIPNPVESAFSYGVPLIFAAQRALSRRHINERLLWGVAAIILAFAVYKTDTRSAWIGLLGALLAAVLLTGDIKPHKRAIGIIAIVIVITAGVYAALHSSYREDLLKRSTSFRPEIWTGTLHKMTGMQWLVGHGTNAPSFVHDGLLTFNHPHSIYLATLYYGGAVGLALLFGLLAVCYIELVRRPASELRTLALTTLTFGATGLLFDGDHLLEKIDFIWIAFWLPVALTACASATWASYRS